MSHAAVFLDKDGTLVDDVPYNVDPAKIVLATGAAKACAELTAAGFRLVVVTNQSGISRGLFDAHALVAVEARLRALLRVPLAGFYHCPHGSQDGCTCRKPMPGMLTAAARDLDVDLATSWMVGDILNDVEAGRSAGCRTVLIENGNETEWRAGRLREPHFRVPGMLAAASAILLEQRIAA